MLLELLEPIKKPRLSDEIVARLHRLIAEAGLGPGDRLPAERELASRLKVSRNSVREALRALEILGLIEVRHGEGSFMRRVDMSTLLSSLVSPLVEKRYFLIEVLEMRKMLEPPICRLAAERAGAEDIAELKRILSHHAERIRSQQPAIEEDLAFHRALAAAAHNEVVEKTIELIASIFREFRHVWAAERPARSVEAHSRIVAAIEAGEGDRAARAMDEHLRTIEALVKSDLLERLGEGR